MKLTFIDKKKKRLDSRHLSTALQKSLECWFDVEIVYNGNAIDGNSLTRQETAVIIGKDMTVGGKSLNEHQEAKNHAMALDHAKKLSLLTTVSIREEHILDLHGTLLTGLDYYYVGRYRDDATQVAGSLVVFPHPLKVPLMMSDLCRWIDANRKVMHPVELAVEAHYRLACIRPFISGNGKMARLLMNMILWQNLYPMALIRKRDALEYATYLENAQLGGSKTPLENLIRKAVERSLDIYIKAAKGDDTPPPPPPESRMIKIGTLAKQAKERVSTIRYWTKLGLIHPAEHTETGYMLYEPETLGLIRRIQWHQARHFTLEEIRGRL